MTFFGLEPLVSPDFPYEIIGITADKEDNGPIRIRKFKIGHIVLEDIVLTPTTTNKIGIEDMIPTVMVYQLIKGIAQKYATDLDPEIITDLRKRLWKQSIMTSTLVESKGDFFEISQKDILYGPRASTDMKKDATNYEFLMHLFLTDDSYDDISATLNWAYGTKGGPIIQNTNSKKPTQIYLNPTGMNKFFINNKPLSDDIYNTIKFEFGEVRT